ncbi:PDZ domain-containing protein [Lentibacillus cibarius]|uniref:PDZ domain-containing protein n=1 Tax=Lentibacillus cibarius TaxID=2583219 RepID=A0A549YMM2_9BACI|nr:PDZ domain-containing protein [Lentibacillus cibarius]TRM13133.1 PDZ domain-containing protein [Lentibacillus cibarius]
MVETWLTELWRGIGRFFVNPLVYWTVILIVFAGVRRIRKERKDFGLKLFDLFAEWRNTWLTSVGFSLLLSAFALGVGIVFSKETILMLAIVTIVLSFSFRFTLLSPVYTIGISYLLLLLLPFVLDGQTFADISFSSSVNFVGLALLLALLLMAETVLLIQNSRSRTFPELKPGRRGLWIGVHHLKKVGFIPFFVLIPTGSITSFASFWPSLTLNGEMYSLALVPFVIGFDHIAQGTLPKKGAKAIARRVLILGLIVLFLAVGSVYAGWLSLAAIFIGIIGREYINYRHRMKDQAKVPFFNKNERGVKVLAVIPDTPAARLGITVGETITKANGKRINDMESFYYALQESGAFFKLEITGNNGEVRFVQSALYEEDHHELGVITTNDRFLDKQLKKHG